MLILWSGKEYAGNHCAIQYSYTGASKYSCVDEKSQNFEGRRQIWDGKLFS